MPNRNIEWNPTDSYYFSYFDKKLKLYQIQIVDGKREAGMIKSNDSLTGVSCMNWFRGQQKSKLIAVGSIAGSIGLVNWDDNEEVFISLQLF